MSKMIRIIVALAAMLITVPTYAGTIDPIARGLAATAAYPLSSINAWTGTNNFTGSFSISGEPIAFNASFHTFEAGTNALGTPGSGNKNSIAIGEGSQQSNTGGGGIISIGVNSANSLTSGRESVILGDVAAKCALSFTSTVAIGGFAAGGDSSCTPGSVTSLDDVYIGEAAGLLIQNTEFNTCVGYNCGFDLVDGSFNTGLGDAALFIGQHLAGDVAVGVSSYGYGKGNDNVLVGYLSGQGANTNHTSNANTPISTNLVYFADTSWATVGDTIFQGSAFYDGLATITAINPNVSITLSENAAVAANSGTLYYDIPAPSTGAFLSGIGYLSLNQISGAASYDTASGGAACRYLLTGSHDTCVGYNSGTTSTTTASYDILIGDSAVANDGTTDHEMSIGNVIYGTNVNPTAGTGKIGINVKNPAFDLEVAGKAGIDTMSAAAGSDVPLCVKTTGEITKTTGTCPGATPAPGYSVYTWAGRPAASGNSGSTIEITDAGPSHCFFNSDGTYWRVIGQCTICSSAVELTHTGDTAETLLEGCVLPAGIIALGETVSWNGLYSRVSGTAGSIFPISRFSGTGGTQISNQTINTASNSGYQCGKVQARDATHVVAAPSNLACSYSFSSGAVSVISATLANALTVDFACQLANSGDTCGLESYEVGLRS